MSMDGVNFGTHLNDRWESRVGRQVQRRPRESKMATAKAKASRAQRPSGLAADFADLLRTVKALFDPYRPELHYMRGPGPKWRAKHAPVRVADLGAVPALLQMKAR